MSRFAFRASSEAAAFAEAVAHEMVRLFGVTEDEAIGRINRQWSGQDLSDPNDIIFHEDEEYWAKDIYYGHGSHWWKDEQKAVPQPFP